MAEQVLGVVSIHRLRTGATVQLYLSVSKGLYQNVVGSSCAPDWTVEVNRPVITPQVTGATLSNPKWYKDGTQIANDGTNYSITSNGVLTFLKSPVDLNNIHNITYTFKCDVETGGTKDTIERSLLVMVHEGGENSYWGNINANGGTVLGQVVEGSTTKEVTSVTLEPTLWCGATKKEYGTAKDYTVKWYKTAGKKNTDGTYSDLEITSTVANKYELSDNGKLIVYRDGVDGMAHFECHFYKDSTKLEAEGIQIVDNADMYFISIAGDKNVYTGSGNTIVLTAGVYKHGTNEIVKTVSSWDVVVTDSERMNEFPTGRYTINKNATDGTGVFRMSESDMYVPNTDKETMSAKPWIKCGDTQATDTAVAATSDATQCDVTVQFIATV